MEWQARAAGTGLHVPALESVVMVSGPNEQAAGAGVLVEAVGPDGATIYRRLIPHEASIGSVGTRPEDAIEAAIQEA